GTPRPRARRRASPPDRRYPGDAVLEAVRLRLPPALQLGRRELQRARTGARARDRRSTLRLSDRSAAKRLGARPAHREADGDAPMSEAAATLRLQDVVVDYRRKHLSDVRAVAGASLT